jgi:hypothetical protein
MQFTVPLTLAKTVGGGGNIDTVKNISLSLHDLISTGRHLLGVLFITSLNSN